MDPSCIVSSRRFESFLKVVEKMKENNRIQIIVPTLIFELFISRRNHDINAEKKIWQTWRTFSFRDVDFLVSRVWQEKFLYTLKDTFLVSIVPAIEFGTSKKIGKNSICKKDVIKKLGNIVGEIIWDMMYVCDKVNSSIISFGEKTITLFSKAGVPIIRGHSRYKKAIKSKARIQTFLRYLIFLMSVKALNDALASYEIENFPLTIGEMGALGVLLVADG